MFTIKIKSYCQKSSSNNNYNIVTMTLTMKLVGTIIITILMMTKNITIMPIIWNNDACSDNKQLTTIRRTTTLVIANFTNNEITITLVFHNNIRNS